MCNYSFQTYENETFFDAFIIFPEDFNNDMSHNKKMYH